MKIKRLNGRTSQLIPHRNPAWEGVDFVGKAEFDKELDGNSLNLITSLAKRFTPSPKSVIALSNYVGGLEGCFLVTAPNSSQFILHTKTVSSHDDLLVAKNVTDFLFKQGCNVSTLYTTVDGEVEFLNFGLYVSASSYIEAQHNFSDRDEKIF